MKTMVSTEGPGARAALVGCDAIRPGAKAGPWVIERELGRGGMGAVYAVVHDAIGKRAALKVVHEHLLPGFNGERMVLEAKVVNQVGHPNIVDIFETGKLGDGRPYIVMERLDGQALNDRADGGKMPADLVIAILLQVCDALIAAHAVGVVHRDLKLDNVFLVDNPDDPAIPKVKVLDWGIAKLLTHDVKHTIEGQLVGTPQYLAPEQARGQPVSSATDVYSLGVMAYELFLEQLPFEAETAAEVMTMHLRLPPPPPRDLWPDMPAALETLLLAMLAKQPALRPTMAEVAHQLTAVRDELARRRAAHGKRAPSVPPPVPARRASSSGPFVSATPLPWQSGTRPWQYAIGVLALVAGALLFWISRAGDRAANAATIPDSGRSGIAEASPPPADQVAPPEAAARRAAEIEPAVQIEEIPLADAGPAPVSRPLAAAPRVQLVSTTPVVRSAAPPSMRAAPRQAARKPVPAPRRGPMVDPDGTLEPYQ